MIKLNVFKTLLIALLFSSTANAVSFDLCVRRCESSGCMSQERCEIACDGTTGFQPRCNNRANATGNFFLQLASFNADGATCDWDKTYESLMTRCEASCESIPEGGPTDKRGLSERGYCFHRCHNLAAVEADSACGR